MSLRFIAATAALVLATSTAALAAGPVTFVLQPQNNSGETGIVTLADAPGGGVTVTVITTGVMNPPAQPIHIHPGACGPKLDPKPTYPLTTLQNGQSTTTIKNVTQAQLENGSWAINIHKSTTEIAAYVSCGDIPKQ